MFRVAGLKGWGWAWTHGGGQNDVEVAFHIENPKKSL